MAIIIHVDYTFKRDNAVDQANLGSSIIAGLTNNAKLFPNPPKTVAELQIVQDALATDVADIEETDSKQARANIKTSRKNWIEAFGMIAQYVDMQAQGLESTITAAGLKATKNFRRKSTIPVTTGFTAGINGVKGSVVGVVNDVIPEAMVYAYYAVPDGVEVSFSEKSMILTVGEQKIFINLSTKRDTEIFTLGNKQTFNVGVFAVNAAGIGPSTPTQTVTTQ